MRLSNKRVKKCTYSGLEVSDTGSKIELRVWKYCILISTHLRRQAPDEVLLQLGFCVFVNLRCHDVRLHIQASDLEICSGAKRRHLCLAEDSMSATQLKSSTSKRAAGRSRYCGFAVTHLAFNLLNFEEGQTGRTGGISAGWRPDSGPWIL